QKRKVCKREARLRHRLTKEARHWLGLAVPNFQEIDRDPHWHHWLSSPDPLTGPRDNNHAIELSVATARGCCHPTPPAFPHPDDGQGHPRAHILCRYLRNIFPKNPGGLASPTRATSYFATPASSGLEGIVSKRLGSRYRVDLDSQN